MAVLFFPQQMLDDWVSDGKIQIDGEQLVLSGRRFALQEAVHFMKCVSDDADPEGLLGRVRTNEDVAAAGAESYGNSVIWGDHAYEVETGFCGSLEDRPGRETDGKDEKKDESTDEELLTKFLIENL